jgi:hypothetical protein
VVQTVGEHEWRVTVVSKSVANPWRDPNFAVLAGQKAVKSWIRQLRDK